MLEVKFCKDKNGDVVLVAFDKDGEIKQVEIIAKSKEK